MNTQFFLILLRNTLLSWVVNIEFVAPLLLFVIAYKNRRHNPHLTQRIKMPVFLLIGAGLVKQLYTQFLFPLAMISENLQLDEIGYWIYLVCYTLLLVSGMWILVKLVYDQRRITPKNPWKNDNN